MLLIEISMIEGLQENNPMKILNEIFYFHKSYKLLKKYFYEVISLNHIYYMIIPLITIAL